MTTTIKKIFIVAAAVVTVACNSGNNNQGKAEFKALPFPDVQVPSMLSDRYEVFEYMAQNYWNGITDPSRNYICDSLYVSGVEQSVVEQKFADWIGVLNEISIEDAVKSVARLYDKALACERKNPSSNVLETFVTLTEKYFYDPNSPLRNEEYYLPFVSGYASYEGLSDVERSRYERDARLCALNRIGTKAADFRFCDRYGRIRNLYDIQADFTLMFFSNPGCNACMQIINALQHDSICAMIESGLLQVLNIYIDEDLQAWREYMPIYPDNWYNGFDPDFVLRNSEMYNIRAIPSLYLLDKEKNVLMKDVPEDVLFTYLSAVSGTCVF